MDIPLIDLSGTGPADVSQEHRRRVGALVDQACRDVGFFAVVGHGVDEPTIERAHCTALDFFDLDPDQRLTAQKPYADYPYGYTPFSTEALSRSIAGEGSPDLKETFNVGPIGPPPRPLDDMTDPDERATWAQTIWPSALPELQPTLEAYYRAMAALADTLMEVFSWALGLEPGWFDPFITNPGSALRLAHYPALAKQPKGEQFRAGAHTDYGTLTILRLDAEPGLEVMTTDRTWRNVEAPADALVINIGDLMARWTNDRWRSTMHRVVVPPGRHDQRRLTMPFFHNANWDATIECLVADGDEPRYEAVHAGAHLMAKFRATVTDAAD